MIRVVLDANVFVSGILAPDGAPGTILRAWRQGRFHLILSHAVLSEIDRVLQYPKIARRHRWADARRRAFIAGITELSIVTAGEIQVAAVKSDPSDDKYLACAEEGEADCIVSGDRHLLNLTAYKGIEILSPRQFADLLGERGKL